MWTSIGTLIRLDMFQVDAMLQKLEKEIDDVDAKIGDRWRLLDRYVLENLSLFSFYRKGGNILL